MNSLPHKCFLVAMVSLFALGAAQVHASDASPRLKYRSKGPVCACESGTGEAEIDKAMKQRRLEQLQVSTPGVGEEAAKGDGQETRREADENRK